jgi:hypothetical protein
MRMVLALALLAGGCVVEHHQDPPSDPPVQPRTCVADITLDGSTGSAAPTKLAAMLVDGNGASVCLHLDATHNLVAAHFAAATDYLPGTTSTFATVLEDASFQTLQQGWDVTVDDTPPRTFANLEWNAPLHEMTDAVLWIRAAAAPTSTSISVALFEPLED